jgi:hypothetical protein
MGEAYCWIGALIGLLYVNLDFLVSRERDTEWREATRFLFRKSNSQKREAESVKGSQDVIKKEVTIFQVAMSAAFPYLFAHPF